ncbi:MAG: aminodeoxychorismate/anthranilate synthase component II [Planctomycetes bacterium RBG_16_64_10]|nr:MAG: aminodeoxychorismate/anthranilate synthase component II [Planctomycetes bacterium RBG_16_64_10]
MILLIDNYDSFVFNLARYFTRLGHATVVVRNDAVDPARVRQHRPRAVVLSPGPCTPLQAGCCLDVVRSLGAELPILGVCLGHQAIGVAFGGTLIRAPEPMHGRTSPVLHNGRGLFRGLPNPLTACRYHSLVLEETSLPDCLQVTARTMDGIVMAIAHRRQPVVGVQFHPEAILTESGYPLLANFLALAGLRAGPRAANLAGELVEPPRPTSPPLPNRPVTF